jgi:uncharacterized cofD-like protein
LAIKGRIFPSTVEDVALVAELEDGSVIQGETSIVKSRTPIRRLRLSTDSCSPLPETLHAIKHADLITIGPGSLYTSIIPNLLVDGIVDAMCDSEALKVYICNIMTQPGETDNFDVTDHLRVLFEYSSNLELDYVVVNTAPIGASLREKYLADGAAQVEFESVLRHPSMARIGTPGRVRAFQLVCREVLQEDGLVRHDPDKLARLILELHRPEMIAMP